MKPKRKTKEQSVMKMPRIVQGLKLKAEQFKAKADRAMGNPIATARASELEDQLIPEKEAELARLKAEWNDLQTHLTNDVPRFASIDGLQKSQAGPFCQGKVFPPRFEALRKVDPEAADALGALCVVEFGEYRRTALFRQIDTQNQKIGAVNAKLAELRAELVKVEYELAGHE
jgi:hypothetical protein